MSANPPSITNETLAQVLAGSAPVGVLAGLSAGKRKPQADDFYCRPLARPRDAGDVMVTTSGMVYVDADLFVSFDRHGYRSGYGASRIGTWRMSLVARNEAVLRTFTLQTPDVFAVVDDFGNLVAVQ